MPLPLAAAEAEALEPLAPQPLAAAEAEAPEPLAPEPLAAAAEAVASEAEAWASLQRAAGISVARASRVPRAP